MNTNNNEENNNEPKNNSKKKHKFIKNKTFKKRTPNKDKPKINKSFINLSKEQTDIVCKNFFNKYDTFEDKIEEVFKKNNIDFLSANYNLEKQLLNDLKKAVSRSKINPQNDFYSYINERWLKDYELQTNQKYIVQVDDFRITQDKVFRELLEIVKEYIKNNNTELSKNIKNFYDAVIKQNTVKQSKYYANFFVNKIDELRKDKTNLWNLLGLINYNEIISWSSPFVWTLNPDNKNPKIYRCYIDGPQLSLNDMNIYFDYNNNEYSRKYKNRVLKYLDDLFTISF